MKLSILATFCVIATTAISVATTSEKANADTSTTNEETNFRVGVDPASLQCLSQNIYFESRGSNLADMAAVANVVLNRVKDRRYPDTICGVIQQGKRHSDGSLIRNQCQFSWYCDGISDVAKNKDKWEQAQTIAYQMLADGRFRGLTEGATHYHATYVKPYWATSRGMTLIGRIGEHVFYRWE
jgi:spore germination cell wall hydrolase CwlJ-like protein